MLNGWATSRLITLVYMLLAYSYVAAQDKLRSLCVAPLPLGTALTAATPDLACSPEKLSLQIDKRERIPWPHNRCARIEALAVDVPHSVVVFCDRKPQQSFKFRFSDYKSEKPCLFLNDLYKTAQLWESRQSPWCKCR